MAKVAKKSNSYREDLHERLKNPEYAAEYVRAALEESDVPSVFLEALRNVAEARGISRLARESDLNRENLYKMLSKRGNPQLESLHAILGVLGLKLTVELNNAS